MKTTKYYFSMRDLWPSFPSRSHISFTEKCQCPPGTQLFKALLTGCSTLGPGPYPHLRQQDLFPYQLGLWFRHASCDLELETMKGTLSLQGKTKSMTAR